MCILAFINECVVDKFVTTYTEINNNWIPRRVMILLCVSTAIKFTPNAIPWLLCPVWYYLWFGGFSCNNANNIVLTYSLPWAHNLCNNIYHFQHTFINADSTESTTKNVFRLIVTLTKTLKNAQAQNSKTNKFVTFIRLFSASFNDFNDTHTNLTLFRTGWFLCSVSSLI